MFFFFSKFKVRMNCDSIVKLNVGGLLFTTSLTTLQSCPNSMLGVMFSGNFGNSQMTDGSDFIDRDGTHFRHILNFLRNPGNNIPNLLPKDEEELRTEAEFYCLKNEMFPVLSELLYFCDEAEELAVIVLGKSDIYCQLSNPCNILSEKLPIIVCTSCHSGYLAHTGMKTKKGVIKNITDKIGVRLSANQPQITCSTGCIICKQNCGEELLPVRDNVRLTFNYKEGIAFILEGAKTLQFGYVMENRAHGVIKIHILKSRSTNPFFDLLSATYNVENPNLVEIHRSNVVISGLCYTGDVYTGFGFNQESADKIKRSYVYYESQE